MSQSLSVVIAARNAEDTIADQLLALAAQDWPAGGEIIVADNGSTDATRAVVDQIQATLDRGDLTLSLIDCGEVSGASYARNAGVRASRNERVAFCDADDIVDSSWVTAMHGALGSHSAVGGRLDLDLLNPDWLVRSRGNSFSSYNDLPTFDGIFPVLSSCNFGIQRTIFDSVGGFDESFLRGQDAELSLRLHQRGIDTHFSSSAVVHYRLRDNIGDIFSQARGWGEVNDRLRERLETHPRLVSTLRSWAWLAVHPHHLADPAKRARWVYVAGLRCGLLTAALRRRVEALMTRAKHS